MGEPANHIKEKYHLLWYSPHVNATRSHNHCPNNSRVPVNTWVQSQYKDGLYGYGIPMLKIRRSWERLMFNMGIPILVRRHLYIETASCVPMRYGYHITKWYTYHVPRIVLTIYTCSGIFKTRKNNDIYRHVTSVIMVFFSTQVKRIHG